MRLCDIFTEEDGKVFNVLDRVFDGPTVVFVGSAGERETLREQRGFQGCVRRDVGIAIIDFARVIRFVTITVSEDEQRPIPRFRYSDAIRRAVNFARQIE